MRANRTNARILLVLAVIATVLVGVALLRASREGQAPTKPPDLVLITVDTLRADRIGAQGYAAARTPTVDGLAERGVLFSQATTPFPRTTPALASLHTGLWPHHHGSREVRQPVVQGKRLAQLLNERGYVSIGVTANSTAGSAVGLHQGFSHFVDRYDLFMATAEEVTGQALALVEQVEPGQQVFLWVHYNDPHWGYDPPASWSPLPATNACSRLRKRSLPNGLVFGNHQGLAAEALEDCSQLYDAEIAYTDSQIGWLLEGLGEAGRLDGAFVVFAADHGENLGEAGLFYEHGPSVHDASLRVPLIITGPGVAEARVDDGVARLEDVMPTLLALLDVPTADWPPMDGLDLSARLRGDPDAPLETDGPVALAESGSALFPRQFDRLVSGRKGGRYCFHGARYSLCRGYRGKMAFFDHIADPRLHRGIEEAPPDIAEPLAALSRTWAVEGARERTARTPTFKLVEYPLAEGGYRRALYDLRADPAESRDVSADHPEVVRRLARHLEEWTKELPGFEAPDRSEEDLEDLRALGYIGD
ncbi:MAG: sulfatase [Deltaproteobacteria bacterium]|nr:sulfatase [Deltaproteobacteria bacterium]